MDLDVGKYIKFCVKNEMLTVAFGDSTMSRTQVQLWYNRFKEGREDVNDDGRPSTSINAENIEAVKKITIIVESLLERLLMILAYRSAHAKQFFRMF